MRIALTADPELPVPPAHYGGIERIVDMLARSLSAAGHEITLFAHPASRSAGRLVPWPGGSSRSKGDTLRNAATLARHAAGGGFDIVHSFSRVAYLTVILALPIPKLMTYQRAISRRSVKLGQTLSRGTLEFSAISRSMMQGVGDIGRWHLVYNGVPLAGYQPTDAVGPDAPLVFLGRIEHIKGTHVAIEVAQRTGVPLVIAGNVAGEHQGYFDTQVRPHLNDRIVHVGPVDDAQKNALLGRARALLMPILWEEPFGIVMAEAMACGTPVIGLARGAVPEVVEDGVTGFVVDDVEGLVTAVSRVGCISRRACRSRVEEHFSDRAVSEAYCAVYRAMLDRNRRADARL